MEGQWLPGGTGDTGTRGTRVALLNENTEVNRGGPEPGDLMVKHDHTALVFAIYRAGRAHPRAQDRSIPVVPGPEQARLQLSQTEYFRQAMPAPSDKRPNEIDHETRFDYLNHRGEGKQAAELILYARVSEMRQQGFEFRKYRANVLENWPDWNGMGDPPR